MIKFKWETEFKETEIGEIPRDWEVRRLKEIVRFIKGISYKSSEINSEEMGQLFITLNNFLRGGGFKNEEFKYYTGNKAKEEQRVKKGDLIIALTDMTSEAKVVGAPAIVSIPNNYDYGFISLDCAKAISLNRISNQYLCFYLSISQEESATFANGVNVLHLNLDHFVEHKLIPYPPPPEQSRIATVLSWFDDLIENKKRQNEILEKVAMAIFKSWFVDFELFKDEEFVYSEELGKEIPKGWEVKPIGEVARIFDGIGYSSDSLTDSEDEQGFLFVTLNNVLEGGGFKPDFKYLRPPSKYKNKTIRELDIVLANKEQTKKGILLGSPALVFYPPDYQKEYALISCNNTAIIPIQEELRYLLYLKIKFNQPEIAQNYHGGTSIWYLHQKQFAEQYFMLIPPQPILQHFHSLVEPLFQKIILNQKQIMVLRKIRDALLPKLIFGKLRVEVI